MTTASAAATAAFVPGVTMPARMAFMMLSASFRACASARRACVGSGASRLSSSFASCSNCERLQASAVFWL